ncbi:MAG: coproporphyrinogen III oxidase family protein [Phycisphaerales bacterium]|nr:coproporphyrinogen III oxidase family protein [Phycisphaerales bacterium]
MLAEPAPADPPQLGLYMHIPFCRKRCKFCYFRVYTDKNARDIDDYMEALATEIGMYAHQPRFAGRQFDFVYFGGGTPSYLSADQLERLIGRINEHWTWDSAKEVTFECEPGTLKESKLQAIKRIGVTRVSLGIEHLDDDVLEINGRAHRSAEVFKAYDWARNAGFKQINVDLIAGMVGETEDKWRDTVERTLALAPDSLTIYQMELPHNTVIVRESRESGEAAPVADWATKRRWVDYAFQRFADAGYVVSSAYTMVKPSPDAGFVYRDALWHGADMVGTGVASFSHVGGIHFQNLDSWETYLASIERGELPLSRALPATKKQLLIRELILQLKLGKLDTNYFQQAFETDVRSEFSDAFAAIEREGYGKVEGEEVRLTRDGLLRVDGLLPQFFEPEFRNIRYT